MSIKLSDYVVKFLKSKGITCAFGMSGGAAVHMFDSLNSHSDINILSMTHEQCAAIAADGYYRSTGKIGVAVTTSGPGATNLLTGTCCSFYDSIPTLMLTGQVSTTRLKKNRPIRQLGFQETDILSMFNSITKYCVQLDNKNDIKYHLEKAFYIALEGRPGPVLIDIPDDLQRSIIDEKELKSFKPEPLNKNELNLVKNVEEVVRSLELAKRPVLVVGGGLKTPDISETLDQLYAKLSIPVLTTWAGLDLIDYNNVLNCGTFGVYGSRLGNLIIQNSDFILVLGSRLSQNMTGGILPAFAREAKIFMVDNDKGELDKFDGRGIEISNKIETNLSDFTFLLKKTLSKQNLTKKNKWFDIIKNWKSDLNKSFEKLNNNEIKMIDAENFVKILSEYIPLNCHIFVDTGGNLTWTCNNIKIKKGQKLFSSWNHTPMGYSLPASIGAAIGNPEKDFLCVIGDGGLMLCLGELATVAKQNLSIKIFLFNNRSHGIQKQTLDTWLEGRKVCVDGGSGLSFPNDWEKVVKSLGLKVVNIINNNNIDISLKKVFKIRGPVFVNVEINEDQKLHPFLKFGEPLENQHPKLPENRLNQLMIVKSYKNNKIHNEKNSGGQGW